MKSLFIAVLGLIFLACSLKVLALPQAHAAGQKVSKSAAKPNNSGDGEQKFRQNCGRCHHAPESISPREVKAVLQHMRVRAMLSEEDEQLILKYLAP
jgi:cytochrome c5